MKTALLDSNICTTSTDYALDGGPVDIKVIDPLNVPENAEFTFVLNSVNDTARWVLTNLTSGESWNSDTIMSVKNEQIISEIGLSVTIVNAINAGDDTNGSNGLLSATLIKENSTSWLDFVPDNDFFGESQGAVFVHPANWIRSGTASNPDPAGGSDPINIDMGSAPDWEDENSTYEGILNGMWAPYRLVGYDKDDIAFTHSPSIGRGQKLNKLTSVDIVYTDDKSLWTRVPVIETGDTITRMLLKDMPSVNKDGIDEVDGTTGFSWFPGYALDLERGTRLNMMFGEASTLPDHNGNDMIWNPTSTNIAGENFFAAFFSNTFDESNIVFGGRHYVYVAMSEYAGDNELDHLFYSRLIAMESFVNQKKVYEDLAWVSIPLASQNSTLLDGTIEVQIRVSKSYEQYNLEDVEGCDAASDINDGNPLYAFETNSIMTVTNDLETATDAMDLIQVVPNPYYGNTNYEGDQIDTRVRITNLPKICTISIYNVSGSLVRRVDLDSEVNVTGWDWDLKNNHNIAIASGVYIIHIDGKEYGEKILKWFGALRPIDLDSF